MDAERPGALSSTTDPDPIAALRRVGLRATRTRLAVLAGLDALGGHRTADELVAGLAGQGGAVPRSTVFAVLDDLVAAGVVRRAQVGAGPVRHELATGTHHHVVCRVCGAIVDVPGPGPDVDVLGGGAVPPGIEVDEVEVVYRGRCVDCAVAVRS